MALGTALAIGGALYSASRGGGGKPRRAKPSEHEKALAETGVKDFNRFMEFMPAKDAFTARLANKGADRARTGRRASLSAARGTAAADAASMGARPGSGAAVMAAGDAADRFSTGVGVGVGTAEGGLHQRDMDGDLKMASLGRGQADAATLGMGRLATDATESALAAEDRRQGNAQSRISARSSVLGMGVSELGNYFDSRDG